mgnify:CR=1 FL=1
MDYNYLFPQLTPHQLIGHRGSRGQAVRPRVEQGREHR